jgi:hypothetical protein
VLKPTSDSLINMELWLPTQNWNGKFMGVGNGGFAGSIQGLTNEMPQALRLGYATAGTDTGHQEQGGSWAIGHPEKLIDFAYRAIHELAALKTKRRPNFDLRMLDGTLAAPVTFTFAAGSFGTFPTTGPIPPQNTEVNNARGLSGILFGQVTQPQRAR